MQVKDAKDTWLYPITVPIHTTPNNTRHCPYNCSKYQSTKVQRPESIRQIRGHFSLGRPGSSPKNHNPITQPLSPADSQETLQLLQEEKAWLPLRYRKTKPHTHAEFSFVQLLMKRRRRLAQVYLQRYHKHKTMGSIHSKDLSCSVTSVH